MPQVRIFRFQCILMDPSEDSARVELGMSSSVTSMSSSLRDDVFSVSICLFVGLGTLRFL